MSVGEQVIQDWYRKKGWQQFPFQKEMMQTYLGGNSGLLNAPTGSGKTFALFLPFLASYINRHPTDYLTRKDNGLLMLWITPLRALTNDIRKAMQEACVELGLPWKVATRTGDTSAAEKQWLKKNLPEVLLTTPESLHLMLAQKEYPKVFKHLEVVVIDEWHELLGTKRGVQVELGLSRLRYLSLTFSEGEGIKRSKSNKEDSSLPLGGIAQGDNTSVDLSLTLSEGEGTKRSRSNKEDSSLPLGEGRGGVAQGGDRLVSLTLSEGEGTKRSSNKEDSSLPFGEGRGGVAQGDDRPGYFTANEKSWNNNITNAKLHRHNPTEAEKLLWQHLRGKKLGFKIRRQHPVLDFIPDFICYEQQLIIEVDGRYHSDNSQSEFDEARSKELSRSGYRIIRFTNDEVLTNIAAVINKIKEELKKPVLTKLTLPKEEGTDGDNHPNDSLALEKGRTGNSQLRIWGISATIGNLEQAAEVLLGNNFPAERVKMVRANIEKKLDIRSVIPKDIETYSWSGHIGIKLLPQVMEIVARSKTTLIFCNTRSQSEIWYHAILDNYPEYAGVMAMHHGSLDNELRAWVEQALHAEALKVVVCTSSLDLGVDFRPVDTIVQVGSPKGVARFMQRAGRSGHHPGATSLAYYVPTHSLELLEGAALKQAIKQGIFESRDPIHLAMDVLIQYMVTLAVSDGFRADELFNEIKSSFAFADISRNEFNQLLDFIVSGGKTLAQYDEFLKVEVENGLYKVNSRRVAMRHRLSIGTITSEQSLRVSWLSGGSLGTIEEGFISKLKPGNVFWFAGRSLEFIKVKEMTAYVKKSNSQKGIIPSWAGGRMPLSSQLSAVFRQKLDEVAHGIEKDEEVIALRPLFKLQESLSHLPQSHEFLIESFHSRDGHHLLFYPFEGRLVHEGMASLLAYRISKIKSASYSIAMNDYGFELLTDEDIPIEEALETDDLFSINNLLDDIQHSLNANEMARRRFRDIAQIGGLTFSGYPGQPIRNKHLQASTSLLFEVFTEYEPDNLLVRQAYNEALAFQLEEFRLREALQRISKQSIVLKQIERPTPFAFPIMVDSLGREKLTTETLEERVAKMARQYGAEGVKTKERPDVSKYDKPKIVRKKGF